MPDDVKELLERTAQGVKETGEQVKLSREESAKREKELRDDMALFRAELDELKTRGKEESDSPNVRRYRYASEALAAAEKEGFEPGIRIAQVGRALVARHGNVGQAMDLIKSWSGADMVKDISRAMDANTSDGGAVVVPAAWSNELIPLLRPFSILAAAGPRRVPIPAGGKVNMPRVASGAVTSWGQTGRVRIKTASKQTLGHLELSQRPLQCLVAVSTDLLQMANIGVDQLIRDDILMGMGTELDRVHLYGSGDNNEPIGLLLKKTGSNAFVSGINYSAQGGAAPTWKTPVKLFAEHAAANGTLIRPHYVMGPTLFQLLCTAESTNGFPVLYQEMSQGRLFRYDYLMSSQITDKATSHNPTDFGLFDYAEYLWGEFESFAVAKSTEAAYYDEAGAIAAPFPNNDTVIRVTWKGDLKPRQLASFTASDNIWTT